MEAMLQALIDHSQRFLAAVNAGAGRPELDALLRQREALIQRAAGAAAAGAAAPPAAVAAWEAADQRVVEELQRRRDALSHELGALTRGRRARTAYRAQRGETSRFVDREG